MPYRAKVTPNKRLLASHLTTCSLTAALGSREDVQQQPSSLKSITRRFIWILDYIKPSRVFNLRGRRVERVSYAEHSTVASRTPYIRSAQIPLLNPWSTFGFEGQLLGTATSLRYAIYSQSNDLRIPFLSEDGPAQYDRLVADNLAIGLTPSSSSSSHPSLLEIPDFTERIERQRIGTEQTTPFELDDHTGDISGVTSSPTDIVPVSVHPLKDKNLFQTTAYIIRPDGEKGGVLMMIDTQSCHNLLSFERWKSLNLKMEPYDRKLYPLQTFSAPVRGVKPHGIVKNVEWHIANHMRTNISDYLVVDMRDYDAVLGQSDIVRYDILRPGPGIERPAVDRNLVQA
ncbi:retropepsin-like aspartic protease [Aspergillus melleus]|uniref:retropepsin-like aspartic protease n=1 Tax=Aspergillus melleus TaxID=138277 RepID=UPI001E8D05CB|nr:uncharacterized protein LDX57_010379 [Aspergillus melleus]KAH8432753.1 hypothetical protein LDX57_010379 [Aspergillus melleus]